MIPRGPASFRSLAGSVRGRYSLTGNASDEVRERSSSEIPERSLNWLGYRSVDPVVAPFETRCPHFSSSCFMSESAEELKSKLSDLPARERAELAYFLIDSLDAEVDPDWESSWNEELRRREAEINARQDTGESADKVFTELRKKHA